MGKEYFVTKFMAGTAEASPKMRWWLRHGSCASVYLQRCDSGRMVQGVSEKQILRATMEKSCAEWSCMVCRDPKNDLMAEHAGLELATIDAITEKDFDRNKLLTITEFMSENVSKQAEFFGKKIPEFPVNRFRDLFLEHVKLFVESVRWFSTPDDRRYASCEDRRMQNTLALAAFSTEWL